ncbi:mechanosensitive ion channel [Archangium violaceum]|uniref:mechanosensitive ion channel family protein n=1 Tax=Archangium violaceum TaxID=83451 RepID=UPI00193B5306|nr:mechanosensitive ion channel domain-containing protein [Archangium violaceum]QRK04760.1 mechanosensitive ion channel [Archangium violaceum]
MQQARFRLRAFRKASLIAVALTSLLLLVVGPAEEALAQDAGVTATEDTPPAEPQRQVQPEEVAREAGAEAQRTALGLRQGLLNALPKLTVVLGTLLLTWLVARGLRALLHLALGRWARADASTALVSICVWLLGTGIAVSVLAGDLRAMLGSVGLVGLALSWALQTPIESFTGWLLNSFQGYYRVGDRVQVGDVFGDVYAIDFLSTTVWELGSPDRPGAVHAEQPTGRLITFPNNEVLTGTIVNLTRDFPYVWDELLVPVANESDLRYAMELLRQLATELLGEDMAGPARQYETLLREARLETSVADRPEVYVSLADAWTNVTIRYLVHARQRRKWKSLLAERVMVELCQPVHAGRIIPVLPRQQVQFLGVDGRPTDVPGSRRE